MIIELIEGNKVEIVDPKMLSVMEISAILGLSRQRVSLLCKTYISSGGKKGIPCVLRSDRYFSSEKNLKKFLDKRTKKRN